MVLLGQRGDMHMSVFRVANVKNQLPFQISISSFHFQFPFPVSVSFPFPVFPYAPQHKSKLAEVIYICLGETKRCT